MSTILYARASTAEQTIDHQLAHARVAMHRGRIVTGRFCGFRGGEEPPGFGRFRAWSRHSDGRCRVVGSRFLCQFEILPLAYGERAPDSFQAIILVIGTHSPSCTMAVKWCSAAALVLELPFPGW